MVVVVVVDNDDDDVQGTIKKKEMSFPKVLAWLQRFFC